MVTILEFRSMNQAYWFRDLPDSKKAQVIYLLLNWEILSELLIWKSSFNLESFLHTISRGWEVIEKMVSMVSLPLLLYLFLTLLAQDLLVILKRARGDLPLPFLERKQYILFGAMSSHVRTICALRLWSSDQHDHIIFLPF